MGNPIRLIDPDGRYVILSGAKELQEEFSSTLDKYLGLSGTFSVSESGYLSVNQLSEEQFNNLNFEQQGFYNEVKFLANTTALEVSFGLVDEGVTDSRTGLAGEDVYVDDYDHGLLDVGDLSKLGNDIGQATTHALYEQAIHDNPVKMTKTPEPIPYEDAHQKAIVNDKKKVGYSFENDTKSVVNGNQVFYRDKVNQQGDKIGTVKITLKSPDNLTIIKYENE